MQHDVVCLVARPAGHQEIAGRQPFPLVVVTGPCGHAMDVGRKSRLRLPRKLGPVPENRILDRAVDIQAPAFPGNLRRQAEVEDGPVLGQMLSRWQALLFRAGCLPGEEASLTRPAFLAACQLAGRRLVIFIGHVCTLPNSTGSCRGPRTVPPDQVTSPAGSNLKSGMRLSHSSIATVISMRA